MSQKTLAQHVAAALRAQILTGVYRPGAHLADLAVLQEFGVSQATARDALHQLEREGWVQRRARHGAYLRTFTPDEAHEVHVLWGEVGALALQWGLTSCPRGDVVALFSPSLQVAELCLKAGESPLSSLFAFYGGMEELAQAAHRPYTAQTLAPLRVSALLYALSRAHDAPSTPDAWRAQVAAATHLLGVIRFGDIPDAQTALREHLLRLVGSGAG
jgi:DNA-binding GntR family transcriptional regulator